MKRLLIGLIMMFSTVIASAVPNLNGIYMIHDVNNNPMVGNMVNIRDNSVIIGIYVNNNFNILPNNRGYVAYRDTNGIQEGFSDVEGKYWVATMEPIFNWGEPNPDDNGNVEFSWVYYENTPNVLWFMVHQTGQYVKSVKWNHQ